MVGLNIKMAITIHGMKGNKMKTQLISMLVSALLSMLSPELLKKFADMVLDYAETYVLGTASTLDDRIVLPICNMIRQTFDIPDND